MLGLAARSFSRLPAKLTTPRSGHTATLLQNNGGVLISGGTTGGADVLSAERFLPWDGRFSAAGSLSAARPGAVVGPTSLDGVLIVAGGGGSASSDLYVFPTVQTDLADMRTRSQFRLRFQTETNSNSNSDTVVFGDNGTPEENAELVVLYR